jgi:hypothetical protein
MENMSIEQQELFEIWKQQMQALEKEELKKPPTPPAVYLGQTVIYVNPRGEERAAIISEVGGDGRHQLHVLAQCYTSREPQTTMGWLILRDVPHGNEPAARNCWHHVVLKSQ